MKLVSLNIEGDAHLERVIPFVSRESPDVLCLQEVYKSNLSQFESLGYSIIFLPLSLRRTTLGTLDEWGLALCTKSKPEAVRTHYYRSVTVELVESVKNDSLNTTKRGVIIADVTHNNTTCRIATVHHTWTPNGIVPIPEQREDLTALLSYLNTEKPHCLCGDMNIPRHHNVLYELFSPHYIDTIPSTYTSSLDKSLHRHGGNPEKDILFTDFMVDYLFTQAPYTAHDVRLEFGVSDHAAVVGSIE